MDKYFFFIGDYLRGKPVYQPLSRILNLLFSISISSFLFEKFYFKYNLLDVTDYKGILDFLIKGQFVVPFAIFLIVHYVLSYGSDMLFSIVTFRTVAKWQKYAYELEFTKRESKKILKKIYQNSFIELPQKMDTPTIIRWYKHIKTTTDISTWNKIRTNLEQMELNINRNFNFAIKSAIVISIYFSNVSYFGWILYTAVLAVIIGLIIGLRAGYIAIKFLPIVVQRLIDQAEKYLEENPEQPKEKTETGQ